MTSSDPLTTMINEASTLAEFRAAAMIAREHVRAGKADSGMVHHLMIRGYEIVLDYARKQGSTMQDSVLVRDVAVMIANSVSDVRRAQPVGESMV